MKYVLVLSASIVVALVTVITLWANQTTEEEKIRVSEETLNIRNIISGEYLEILGEVVNETEFIIGRVKVVITIRDRSGKILDTDYTYVRGRDVEINGYSDDSGILANSSAPFSELFTAEPILIDSIGVVEFAVNYDIADPRTDIDQTPLMIRISRMDSVIQRNLERIEILESQSSGSTSNFLKGDLDQDGDVDFRDFVTFARNYGRRS